MNGKNVRLSYAIRLAIFVLCVLAITVASVGPAVNIPMESGDKLAHLLSYGTLAMVGYFIVGTRRSYLLLCLSIIAYSGAMEIVQYFIPGRFMSGLDILANSLGVLLGVFLVIILLGPPTTANGHSNGAD